MSRPSTIGELKRSGYKVRSVKDEMRENLIEKLKRGEELFPGIIGYEKTVIPEIINAILAKHDFILLGLRGQAKTRILRTLPTLLDDFIPIIKGCEVNDNPYNPVCKPCNDKIKEGGDDVEIEWIPRDRRYGEKLATPDVTIADLIGDIDPIKAATQRLYYSHEGVIHFGIIPRTNRGIFAINELPDLQPRIQVGLLNILQESDIQIRGFPIRIPLDILIVFTANPEDYTNRGNIITPLRDRIDSQILTHYPKTMEDAIKITSQEAWITRNGDYKLLIPHYLREIVEQIAFKARSSEYVDQKSGVSARMPITCLENLVSNAERRAISTGEKIIVPRICDLPYVLPAMTGKMELVYEGEEEGPINVAKNLIGEAVREVFSKYFPDPTGSKQKPDPLGIKPKQEQEKSCYHKILEWFQGGNKIEISDDMPFSEYLRELDKVNGLREVAQKHLKIDGGESAEIATAMEFVLEGLHQNSRLSKKEIEHKTAYRDMLSSIFDQ
ncbi:MAG: magnesium chelatase [bacterium]